ncbi:hypothetical protein BDV98DRAFT_597982 [Pterulicium gracile]|uniref:MYND-type domain-containing protein n=1 Tax=Pterulicium gracile TaxID=1884261 RepID=A0A5C3Q283_9AGAR|nr:hypothetical protein BDV98DRAFT_597982 [Pterula gracilis]
MSTANIAVEGFRYSYLDRLEFDMVIPIKPASLTSDMPKLTDVAGSCGDKTRSMGVLKAAHSIALGAINPKDMDIDDKVYGPEMYPRNGSCFICHTEERKLFKCSVCMMTQYCTEECQHEDWARHQKACKWFTGVRVVGRPSAILSFCDVVQIAERDSEEGDTVTWK